MILAFHLSMPNCASWDGRWSGEGRKYVIVITFEGQSRCLSEWAELLGIPYKTLHRRIRSGISAEEAFATGAEL